MLLFLSIFSCLFFCSSHNVLDLAKQVGKTIECPWKDEEVEMVSDSEKEFKYFIRVKKSEAGMIENLVKAEKTVEVCDDETGMVSSLMKEGSARRRNHL